MVVDRLDLAQDQELEQVAELGQVMERVAVPLADQLEVVVLLAAVAEAEHNGSFTRNSS